MCRVGVSRRADSSGDILFPTEFSMWTAPPPLGLHPSWASQAWRVASLTFSLWISSNAASSSPAGWLPLVSGNQASRGIRSRLG